MARLLLLVFVACAAGVSTTRVISDRNAQSDVAFRRELAAIGVPVAPGAAEASVEFAGGVMTVRGEDAAVLPPLAATGLRSDEAFVRAPQGLLFVGAHCVTPGSCGLRCSEHAQYHVMRAPDGHTVLVRERIVREKVRVKVATCTYGCGTQLNTPESFRMPVIDLGALEPSVIEVRDLEHRVWQTEEYCDKPIAVP